MRSLAVVLALALSLVAPTASVAAQSDSADPCAPTPLNDEATFFMQKITPDCPRQDYPPAVDPVDVPDDLQSSLAQFADLVRDDGSLEVLILIRPGNTPARDLGRHLGGRVIADLFINGKIDGHQWQKASPPADAGN